VKNSAQKLVWVFKGFILGIASLIPGVSAGTLALIMNIYEQIVSSVTNLFSFFVPKFQKKRIFIFLFYLLFGALLAIFSLARLITWLLSHQPVPTYSVFTGLICASLPNLLKLTDKKKGSLFIITMSAVSFFTVLHFSSNVSEYLTINSFFLIFLSGFLGFFGSALPGVSGSAVLLILGTYHVVLNAVTQLIIYQLLLFLGGGLLGLVVAIYSIRLFLRKRKNLFFCIIIGLILGSLKEMTPLDHWSDANLTFTFVKSILFFCFGIVLYVLIERRKL